MHSGPVSFLPEDMGYIYQKSNMYFNTNLPANG